MNSVLIGIHAVEADIIEAESLNTSIFTFLFDVVDQKWDVGANFFAGGAVLRILIENVVFSIVDIFVEGVCCGGANVAQRMFFLWFVVSAEFAFDCLCDELLYGFAVDDSIFVYELRPCLHVGFFIEAQDLQLSLLCNLVHHAFLVHLFNVGQSYLPLLVAGQVFSAVRHFLQFQAERNIGE